MALKVRFTRPAVLSGSLPKKILWTALVALCVAGLVGFAILGFYYRRYEKIVDARLAKPLFVSTASIYAAPRELRVGQKLSARDVAVQLRAAGYTDPTASSTSPLGSYSEGGSTLRIQPGPQSYHAEDGATISFSGGKIAAITGDQGQQLAAYELEPMLITGLSDANRAKRRLVTYNEIPPNFVNAVVSIEDRRFFEHGGVDYWRILGALRNDLTHRHAYMEGGSTLTMQTARGFFLTPEKRLRRKLIEILITFQLEHRFSKQQIFEMYANQIPLGQQGSFAINGVGEAAHVYFHRDVRQMDLAQCALLAGMIQRPSELNPYRHPSRALARRNLVLDAMVETGHVSKAEAEAAKAEGLGLGHVTVDAGDAPYFVDLVREQLSRSLGERDYNREGLRIYTSLDPDLERAATEAVESQMGKVDEMVRRLYLRRARAAAGKGAPEPALPANITYPQVALVALNPHTGQVLALVGGRNYGQSQLNHAVAQRPTGSIFKPFVYAAAFNTALAGTALEDPERGSKGIFTPVTLLSDQQTTYTMDSGEDYTPKNFHGEYHDEVTARYALQMSLNNATIALASMVGFNTVASLAREAGIRNARGTPSVAIGSYDATPIDMAGAYTTFANGGVKIDPWMVASVRSKNGDVVSDFTPASKPILDPRVAYLTTNLLENVINSGTAAGVRAMGFTAPAAGKTGTSHDAWFAGYTSNLLCVVWVGNDDYTDIKIEGAHAAAPIWADFMMRAVKLPQYSDTKPFTPPEGIELVRLDKQTNLLADSACPDQNFDVAFLAGTAPTDTCDHANQDQRNMFEKLFGIGSPQPLAVAPPTSNGPVTPAAPGAAPGAASGQPAQTGAAQNGQQEPRPGKKKGFFGRVFGALKGGDEKEKQQTQPAEPPPQG